MLDGVEVVEGSVGIQFQGVLTKPHVLHIKDKIGFSNHPMLEHFKFLKAHTKVTPKMTIPSPAVMHFRLEPNAVDKSAYASRDDIFDDLAGAYQKAVKAFYDAGCRYLQFDDTAWAYLCSQEELKKARERGLDVDHLQESYTRCINKALEAKPADMTITTHVCRGNFRSTFISSGGYEPVAESLLAKCNYDGYFLEYDTDRAGGFEPLRFLPKGNKIVVLGLVTSKTGTLEKKDDIKRRIDEATKFVALDQLCLSPQCGFASTEEGNVLAEEEQWAKLRMIVELSQEVWGR
jgi:5-methyltetrahydropteroyltriglutamate--homocysteine methyltransferase